MSSPQIDGNDSESVDEVPNDSLGRGISVGLWRFQNIPLGIRLFPIVFFCNFLEIIQFQVVMLSHGLWDMCIDWKANQTWSLCTSMGLAVLVATAIQFGWPVTGLIMAVLTPRLSTPESRIRVLREFVRVKVFTIICFFTIFFLKFWPLQYTLCLLLVVMSFFSTFTVLLLCKMMVVDVVKDNWAMSTQLAIVLGAQKASSAGGYIFVLWIMNNWGFPVLIPVTMFLSLFLFCYAWSSCIDQYMDPSLRRTEEESSVTYQNNVENTSTSTSTVNDNFIITTGGEGDLQGDAVVSHPRRFDTYRIMIRQYFNDYVKLLKTSYFFGVYALGLLEFRAPPVQNPYDRSKFLSNLPFLLETVGLLFVLPFATNLAHRALRRQYIMIGNGIQDDGSLEDQLNVNRRTIRDYLEDGGFSLNVWWAIACSTIAAIAILLLSPPWTDLRLIIVVTPLFTLCVGFYPALQSAICIHISPKNRGTGIAHLEVIGYLGLFMSGFTIQQWDRQYTPIHMVGLNIPCLVIYSFSASLATVFAFLGWRRWRALLKEVPYARVERTN